MIPDLSIPLHHRDHQPTLHHTVTFQQFITYIIYFVECITMLAVSQWPQRNGLYVACRRKNYLRMESFIYCFQAWFQSFFVHEVKPLKASHMTYAEHRTLWHFLINRRVCKVLINLMPVQMIAEHYYCGHYFWHLCLHGSSKMMHRDEVELPNNEN